MPKLIQEFVDFIKEKEGGPYLKTYECPAGELTIGYGHTGMIDNKKVGLVNDDDTICTITAAEANALLLADLKKFENVIKAAITANLTDNQYSALVSFVFNVGSVPKELQAIINKDPNDPHVAYKFLLYSYVTKKGVKQHVSGLLARRQMECEMYFRDYRNQSTSVVAKDVFAGKWNDIEEQQSDINNPSAKCAVKKTKEQLLAAAGFTDIDAIQREVDLLVAAEKAAKAKK